MVSFIATVSAGVGPLNLYFRYNYDSSFQSSTSTVVTELPNVHLFSFTYEHNVCSFTVYPRVEAGIASTDILGSVVGANVKKMPYCDVNRPVPILGAVLAVGGTFPSPTTAITMSTTYHLKFKYVR